MTFLWHGCCIPFRTVLSLWNRRILVYSYGRRAFNLLFWFPDYPPLYSLSLFLLYSVASEASFGELSPEKMPKCGTMLLRKYYKLSRSVFVMFVYFLSAGYLGPSWSRICLNSLFRGFLHLGTCSRWSLVCWLFSSLTLELGVRLISWCPLLVVKHFNLRLIHTNSLYGEADPGHSVGSTLVIVRHCWHLVHRNATWIEPICLLMKRIEAREKETILRASWQSPEIQRLYGTHSVLIYLSTFLSRNYTTVTKQPIPGITDCVYVNPFGGVDRPI